ncbi:hypothetical protein CYQ12_12605, partial [Enterococcus faecium]
PTVTLIPNGIHHPPIEDGRLLPNSVHHPPIEDGRLLPNSVKGMLATLTILGYHHIFIMNDLFVYQTTHIVQRKSRLGTWLF